jgi:hypothetical protein
MCELLRPHISVDEDSGPVVYDAMSIGKQLSMLWRNLPPPFARSKQPKDSSCARKICIQQQTMHPTPERQHPLH